jgi:serine/threonine protein kinase/tetratricopeptide (TPR) repeat protein
MKTISPGLSDSIASVLADPRPCPHCDSSSHIAGGLCVGCLLEAGLDPEDEGDSESLVGILAEINLPDQNWRLGNYEILEEIGRGGMGVIYRARQRHSRRIVAVKRVLSYHSDSRETLARFRREAQAAASLDHPNILPIYEVSESEDGLPFFSMKFAPGGTLQQVASALRNEPRQCVALVAKIARAVQYAHGRGILHRDLKPGNILLDGRSEPLVSDFGLAKWLDTASDLTRTLTIFGTPGYIAPEQASAAAADLKPTADIYSLGAILFDLLAGRPPFLGAHALSVIRQASELPAPKLRTLSKIADRDLETICSRCLERDPGLRYPSAHDLAEDLERWLEGRPIIARPVSPPVKLWRWSKRNPLLAASITACAALAATAISWQIRSSNLEVAAREEAIAANTVSVLPFLNLDDASNDTELPIRLADGFRKVLERVGPANVVVSQAVQDPKNPSDPKTLAARQNFKLLLSGTHRTLGNGRQRLSLRFMDSDGNLLLRKIVEVESLPGGAQTALEVAAPEVFPLFAASRRARAVDGQRDPGMINDKAREFILAGRELMNRQTLSDLDHALKCFEKAVEIEPTSALGHAYFTSTVATRLHFAFDQRLFERATQTAQRAVELSPDLPEAHRALAGISYHQGDLSRALSEAYHCIELGGPEIPMLAFIGDILKVTGQPHRALIWFERMAQWRRRPAEDSWMIGDCWSDLVEDERAEANYSRVFDLNPDLPQGWLGICRLRCLHRDFAAARLLVSQHSSTYRDHFYSNQMVAQVELFARNFPEAEKLYKELATKDAEGGGAFYGAISFQSALGRLRIAAGDEVNGRVILERALDKELQILQPGRHHPESLYRIAAIESSLGRSDDALSHLRDAFRSGWIDYRSMDLDPRFDLLRSDHRYQELLEAMRTQVAILRRSMPTD